MDMKHMRLVSVTYGSDSMISGAQEAARRGKHCEKMSREKISQQQQKRIGYLQVRILPYRNVT